MFTNCKRIFVLLQHFVNQFLELSIIFMVAINICLYLYNCPILPEDCGGGGDCSGGENCGSVV